MHAKTLDKLKARIERMEAWNEREDIRKAWKIAPFHRKEAIAQSFMI
ncbi:hypothetical protein L0M14_13660 [Paenibacillus hexagrammi]|uniref:Uncharacterized protein n=1 Tax=Paenibacillus hexagrammi TaxID=2908839 RepID=A0ABY3SRY7_9BACL|nr:hypothetical protein [Paenibacillus sp. YPD9-1]UJF36024.1 hypothetical protein L0M14_13660 [Paenibacillus sp. YPD9-1]